MQGRWTIRIENGFGNYTKGPSTLGWVPVVPCDDAAIARAADAIADADPDLRSSHAREFAEVALRAAGETP